MKKILLLCAAMTWAGVAVAGPIMHVHDSDGNLGTVDVATGDVTVIGDMGVQMTDIAFDPSGNLFGISFTDFYSINATTAETTHIGSLGIDSGNALVFGSDGTLYAAANTLTSLLTIDPTTGSATSLGNMGFASAGDLAFHDGNFYLAAATNELVEVDLDDVSNSAVVGEFGVADVFGLATGDDGNLYAVAGTSIYTVNTATGAATNGVSFGGGGLGTAYGESFYTEAGAVEVPEPGSLALLGAGLIAFGFMRRSRRA